jgi:acetylornithine deacetylase/succinyl-diaminopimelate desuccinylase-like protein
MRSQSACSLGLLLLAASPVALAAETPVDTSVVTQIRDEGFNRSKVMETAAYLTDVIGPRLSGSPAAKTANEWTRDQLAGWGLSNAHLESFGPFGKGWSFDRCSVSLVSPVAAPVIALPKAWTPGTAGPVRGKVVKAKIDTEADLEKWKGKLAGAIVFLADARDLKAPDKALFNRYTDTQLTDLSRFEIPGPRGEAPRPGAPPFDREELVRRFKLQRKLREFFVAEKALATVEPSDRDGGVVRVAAGGSREKDEDPGVTGLVMAAEHYNRICRLLDRKLEVELEIDVKARFHDEDLMAYNTVAEIPGTDKQPEVVMVGAHLDSWHSGTGATDNGAGSVVALEAMRILKAIGVKPRRTIRIGLWTGEEQGLLGSRGYVAEHFGSRPEPTDPIEKALPRTLRKPLGPLTIKPEHARFSVYFNLDNGTGKIRGVYTQQNAGALPIFEEWLKPFADLGATTVTERNTGGTDHQSFDAVGLPGFQFIQDEADYATRTHHTNMDVYDRLQREDLMQAAVIMASFAYNAAMREGTFPRKPLPKDPPAVAADTATSAAAPAPANAKP